MSDIKKIGLFGGTFDPPHIAHINLINTVIKKLNLHTVYFIPTAKHPLKENTKITSVEIRCEMLEAALNNYPEFRLSKIEIDRPAISFTIDTIKNFCRYEKISNATLFFILGSDNINEFHLWKDPEQIFKLAKIVVLRRPGSEESPVIDKYKNRIILMDLPLIPVSSTDLRHKIGNGQDYHNLIPCGVAEIIDKYNLYR